MYLYNIYLEQICGAHSGGVYVKAVGLCTYVAAQTIFCYYLAVLIDRKNRQWHIIALKIVLSEDLLCSLAIK
jgi:hypothetical protein